MQPLNLEEKYRVAVQTLESVWMGLAQARQSCDREALARIPILEGKINDALWLLGVGYRESYMNKS